MDLHRLPRYFLNRTDGASQSVAGELIEPVHIVDCFFIESRSRAGGEYMITVDNLGNLQAIPASDKNNLPMSLQAELSFHEMTNRSNLRRLFIDEFYLFNIQLLEQPTNTPGLDDPIYLYGSLTGPFPTTDNAAGLIFEGQLTVTRADLLGGFLQAANYSFCYTGAISNNLTRCFHLMLAGDRDEEIRQGRGVVLAYPLMPPELIVDNISNEFNSCQLLFDILSALKEDLNSESIRHSLRETVIPVPNRMRLEQQLQADGYIIKGDTATKQTSGTGKLGGLLSSLVGVIAGNRITLPPEGKILDYLKIANTLISSLPGWPPARLLMLNERVKIASAAFNTNYVAPPIKIPAGGPLVEARINPQPRPQMNTITRQDGPPGWMQDFISAHKQSGTSSRLTSMSDVAQSIKVSASSTIELDDQGRSKQKTQQLPAQTVDWMSDFGSQPIEPSKISRPARVEPKHVERKEPKKKEVAEAKSTKDSAVRPSWMDDFE